MSNKSNPTPVVESPAALPGGASFDHPEEEKGAGVEGRGGQKDNPSLSETQGQTGVEREGGEGGGRGESGRRELGGSEVPDWLPATWRVEWNSRQNGATDKVAIEKTKYREERKL